MSENSGIEWTDHTFNPWWGCQKVSPGCEHCYAETLSNRFGKNIWGPPHATDRRLFGDKHWAEPLKWNRQAEREGRRARVFCASMADVFEAHPQVTDARTRLWDLIEETPHLDWQLLTKRPQYVHAMVPAMWMDHEWPANVWLGTSVEDQQRADERIPALLGTPAAVRFLSCEPLLGPVNLRRIPDPSDRCNCGCGPGGIFGQHEHWCGTTSALGEDPMGPDPVHWVIVGGESGPGARPMEINWARSIVDQCKSADVPVFVKQLGSKPTYYGRRVRQDHGKGGDPGQWPSFLRRREFPAEVPA